MARLMLARRDPIATAASPVARRQLQLVLHRVAVPHNFAIQLYQRCLRERVSCCGAGFVPDSVKKMDAYIEQRQEGGKGGSKQPTAAVAVYAAACCPNGCS